MSLTVQFSAKYQACTRQFFLYFVHDYILNIGKHHITNYGVPLKTLDLP